MERTCVMEINKLNTKFGIIWPTAATVAVAAKKKKEIKSHTLARQTTRSKRVHTQHTHGIMTFDRPTDRVSERCGRKTRNDEKVFGGRNGNGKVYDRMVQFVTCTNFIDDDAMMSSREQPKDHR